MSQHTPGPWRLIFWDHKANKHDLYACVQTKVAAIDIVSPGCMAEDHEANARLIAAAPELLAIVRRVRDYGVPKFSHDIAEVLKRIDGEQP